MLQFLLYSIIAFVQTKVSGSGGPKSNMRVEIHKNNDSFKKLMHCISVEKQKTIPLISYL